MEINTSSSEDTNMINGEFIVNMVDTRDVEPEPLFSERLWLRGYLKKYLEKKYFNT